MNKIALEKVEKLLDYLCNDLENAYDTSVSRAKQMEGIETFKWKRGLWKVEDIQFSDFHKIYYNWFAPCRSRFDEYSRVNLT